MTVKDLKKVLLNRPDGMEDKLYDYGYECGRRNVIIFEIVQQVFYIYDYTGNEKLRCIRKILKGFKDGSRAAR